jgi:Emfourin
MRLTLTRTGGFGGLRQASALDAAWLTPGERAELRRRLEEAGFWTSPASIAAAAPAPDRLRYRLAVEDGPRRHEVLAAEEAAPEPLLALIRWVEERARPTPPAKR